MSAHSYPAGHLSGAASESTKKNTGPVVNRRCPGLGTPDRRLGLRQAIGTTDDGAAEGHRSAAGAQVQLFLRTAGGDSGPGRGDVLRSPEMEQPQGPVGLAGRLLAGIPLGPDPTPPLLSLSLVGDGAAQKTKKKSAQNKKTQKTLGELVHLFLPEGAGVWVGSLAADWLSACCLGIPPPGKGRVDFVVSNPLSFTTGRPTPYSTDTWRRKNHAERSPVFRGRGGGIRVGKAAGDSDPMIRGAVPCPGRPVYSPPPNPQHGQWLR